MNKAVRGKWKNAGSHWDSKCLAGIYKWRHIWWYIIRELLGRHHVYFNSHYTTTNIL